LGLPFRVIVSHSFVSPLLPDSDRSPDERYVVV
jgi:hypothetical protein